MSIGVGTSHHLGFLAGIYWCVCSYPLSVNWMEWNPENWHLEWMTKSWIQGYLIELYILFPHLFFSLSHSVTWWSKISHWEPSLRDAHIARNRRRPLASSSWGNEDPRQLPSEERHRHPPSTKVRLDCIPSRMSLKMAVSSTSQPLPQSILTDLRVLLLSLLTTGSLTVC